MAFTLAELSTRARERADMLGSLFISSTELTSYLQAANRELYYHLVSKYEKHFVYTYKFQHEFEADQRGPIPLPDKQVLNFDPPEDLLVNPGFYKLLTVYVHDPVPEFFDDLIGQDYEFTKKLEQLYPCSVEEEGRFLNPRRLGRPTHYVLYGKFHGRIDPKSNAFYLQPYPIPDNRYAFMIKYVPVCPDIPVNDLVDGVPDPVDEPRFWNPYITGADEFVVVAAAIKMKDKEESDVSTLMQEKEALLARIEGALTPIDAGMPEQVRQHQRAPGFPISPYYDELG